MNKKEIKENLRFMFKSMAITFFITVIYIAFSQLSFIRMSKEMFTATFMPVTLVSSMLILAYRINKNRKKKEKINEN